MGETTPNQLRKIIKSSQRIRNLKKRFGLSPDSYVRKIYNSSFYIDSSPSCRQVGIVVEDMKNLDPEIFENAHKHVLIKKVEGKSAWDFYHKEAPKEIKKIIKYFDLDIDVGSFQNMIFWGNEYPFSVLQPDPNKIVIEIFDDLDKEQIRYLLERVKRKLELRRIFVEAKKGKKIVRQLKTIFHFDEEYLLFRKYEAIKNKNADKKTKAEEKKALAVEAGGILNKKYFNVRDLEKTIFNFRKQFEEE